jgi:hypothetical protein
MIWGPDNHDMVYRAGWKGDASSTLQTGQITELLQIKDYYRKRLGLMSMALHPGLENAVRRSLLITRIFSPILS